MRCIHALRAVRVPLTAGRREHDGGAVACSRTDASAHGTQAGPHTPSPVSRQLNGGRAGFEVEGAAERELKDGQVEIILSRL
jgi:hypothetical protein